MAFILPRPVVAQAPVGDLPQTFDSPAANGGRGGDLDPTLWAVSRLAPNQLTGPGLNFLRHAAMPGGSVYPPDDMVVSGGVLTTGIVIQNYGTNNLMIRRPFDFAGRTGTIKFDVDAFNESSTATWINVAITEDPTPAPTRIVEENNEPGPVPRNGLVLSLALTDNGGDGINISQAYVYTNYTATILSPSFIQTGGASPRTEENKRNRFEVRLSETVVQVYASDCSQDGGQSFPNFRRVYEASHALSFTRGYVHFAQRNHATIKFNFPATRLNTWDNITFDGPVLPTPRAYEIPDNTTTGVGQDGEEIFDYMNLGYEVSDGSNKAEGIWNPGSRISPLSVAGSVNLAGAASALLTLNLWVNAFGSATTSWGLKYRFNGGTWRTRTFTAGEVSAVNTAGSGGMMALAIALNLADLVTGTNTIDFSAVNVPMNFPPMVCNIDLWVFPS